MYKLGSHNSMTYLPPKQWWLKPFHFIAKCQNKTLQEQYECGVRVFDIRVKWDNKNDKWVFAHGSMTFKCYDVKYYFNYLNNLNEHIDIRLILEYNREPNNIDYIVNKFQNDVKEWQQQYINISFFAFNRKYDWLVLCHANYKPTIYQAVSSMTGSILDDWCPWFYAKLHNKDILKQGTDKNILLIDFV